MGSRIHDVQEDRTRRNDLFVRLIWIESHLCVGSRPHTVLKRDGDAVLAGCCAPRLQKLEWSSFLAPLAFLARLAWTNRGVVALDVSQQLERKTNTSFGR